MHIYYTLYNVSFILLINRDVSIDKVKSNEFEQDLSDGDLSALG